MAKGKNNTNIDDNSDVAFQDGLIGKKFMNLASSTSHDICQMEINDSDSLDKRTWNEIRRSLMWEATIDGTYKLLSNYCLSLKDISRGV